MIEVLNNDKANGKRFKWSFYNITHKIKGGVLVYNTAGGALIFLDNEHIAKIKNFMQNRENHLDTLKDLLDEGFIMPYDVDEKQKICSLYQNARNSKETFGLTILPSEDCNFRCIYCYEKFRRKFLTSNIENAIVEMVKKRCESNNVKLIRIAWFGGEPLLNKNSIKRISKCLIELSECFNIKYRAQMSTNGYLLNRKTFEEMCSLGIKQWQVTIDGPAVMHNKYRPFKNGHATFGTIVSNLQEIQKVKVDFNFVIRSNFDKENAKFAPEFMDFYKNNFGNDNRFHLYFRAIYPSDTMSNKNIDLCDLPDSIDVIDELMEMAVEKGIGTFFWALPYPRPTYCDATLPNHLIIGADGSVWKCTVNMHKKDLVGKLCEDGNIEYNSRIHDWIRFSPDEDKICKECIFLPICQSGCLAFRRRNNCRPCLYTMRSIKKIMKLTYFEKLKGGDKDDSY